MQVNYEINTMINKHNVQIGEENEKKKKTIDNSVSIMRETGKKISARERERERERERR